MLCWGNYWNFFMLSKMSSSSICCKKSYHHGDLLLEWLTPFLSPLFLLYSILVSSFYLSVNIVVLYQFNLKREVSRSDKQFKIAIISRRRSEEHSLFQAVYYLNAWNRLQRRKEWICESRCQVRDCLYFFAEYFDLNSTLPWLQFMLDLHFLPRLRFILSLQSGVLHSVCIYPLIRSP